MNGYPHAVENAPDPHLVVAKIAALQPQANNNVKNQHVISRVILRRFTEPVGPGLDQKLAYLSLKHPQTGVSLSGPAGCGKIDNFIGFASASSEALWGATENKMHAALAAVDSGTVFSDPTAAAVIRDAMALHFVRSIQTQVMFEAVWNKALAANRARWLQNPALLNRLFYERFGLNAAGQQALDLVVDDLLQGVTDYMDSGALFRVRLEAYFDIVRTHIMGMGLEIGTAQAGEFVLGDIPAVSVRMNPPALGMIGGVSLGEADTVVFPLGPHHVATLGPTDQLLSLPADHVDKVNEMQIRAAVNHVYFRPSSNLDAFVRSIRAS